MTERPTANHPNELLGKPWVVPAPGLLLPPLVFLLTFDQPLASEGLLLSLFISTAIGFGVLLILPMTTSNYFEAGHRIRIEVSSSNFPRFDRNLNTGGRNYDETKSVVARNAVHHSKEYPSEIRITVVRK